MNETNGAKCLFPDCKSKTRIASRGLCQSHYSTVAHLVKTGKLTWEKLESEGKILPKKQNNQFKQWLGI